MSGRRVIVLASGGIDSTACIAYYLELKYGAEAMFINYGHPANHVEHQHLLQVCQRYGVPVSMLTLHGANIMYPGEIRGRNAFFIIAALMAKPNHNGLIALGIHSDSPYYDCGDRFVELMQELVINYTDGTVKLDLPLIEMNKLEILDYCKAHNVPLELTYSCELGTVPPCGHCPSCKDRIALGLSS